jgi:hypothetical protein
MGEDARRKSDGQSVKIGTCESMYYLRFDQRGDVAYPWPALTDSEDNLDPFLYRFPDPREDGTLPGEYEGAWGGVKLSIKGFWNTFGDKVDHYTIQATDTGKLGYLFNLPCPEGNPELYRNEMGQGPRVGRNGGTTTVTITAQRWFAGRLVLVVQCAACRHSIRLTELADVQPILDELKRQGDHHRQQADYYLLGGRDTSGEVRAQLKANELKSAAYWDEVAARIVAGYNYKGVAA